MVLAPGLAEAAVAVEPAETEAYDRQAAIFERVIRREERNGTARSMIIPLKTINVFFFFHLPLSSPLPIRLKKDSHFSCII